MTREEAINKVRQMSLPKETMEILQALAPELTESEDERIRKELLHYIQGDIDTYDNMVSGDYDSRDEEDKKVHSMLKRAKAYLEKQKEPTDKGEISDGYHTFNELYYYRMLYNAAFFNLLPKELVHKSKRHHDGEECFGGGWFIVMANLPTGQISNHYELKDWELFQIPEKEVADEWDGHTPQEAAKRLYEYLLTKQKEQKPAEEKKVINEDIEQAAYNYAKQFSDNGSNYIEIRDAYKAGAYYQELKQKPAEWSEEDEKIRLACIATINDVIDYDRDRWEDYNPGKPYRPITKYDEQIDWLKSLRPQPHTVSTKDAIKFGNLEYERGVKDGIQSEKSRHWKPSEEQMNALKFFVAQAHYKADAATSIWTTYENLVSLFNDLKKL